MFFAYLGLSGKGESDMRKKRGKHARENVSQAAASMTVILCLAVMTGFFGVKYVVSPWMNGTEAQVSATMVQGRGADETVTPQDVKNAQNGAQPQEEKTPDGAQSQNAGEAPGGENQNDGQPQEGKTPDGAQSQQPQSGAVVEGKVDTVATKAFAVQLGSFSTEEAARQRIDELSAQGIQSSAQLRDGVWKVVSSGYSTKEEAKAAAVRWRSIVGDAFVVEI